MPPLFPAGVSKDPCMACTSRRLPFSRTFNMTFDHLESDPVRVVDEVGFVGYIAVSVVSFRVIWFFPDRRS